MNGKYYWFSYVEVRPSGGISYDSVCVKDVHPFEQIAEYQDMRTSGSEIFLLNYKEISKEEYDLAAKIHAEQEGA